MDTYYLQGKGLRRTLGRDRLDGWRLIQTVSAESYDMALAELEDLAADPRVERELALDRAIRDERGASPAPRPAEGFSGAPPWHRLPGSAWSILPKIAAERSAQGRRREIPSAATLYAVLGALSHCADRRTLQTYAGVDRIAEMVEADRRTVQRALRVLVSHGLLEVVAPASRYRPTTYRVVIDEGAALGAGAEAAQPFVLVPLELLDVLAQMPELPLPPSALPVLEGAGVLEVIRLSGRLSEYRFPEHPSKGSGKKSGSSCTPLPGYWGRPIIDSANSIH